MSIVVRYLSQVLPINVQVKEAIAESVEAYLVMLKTYVSSLLFDGFPEMDEVLEGDSGMD